VPPRSARQAVREGELRRAPDRAARVGTVRFERGAFTGAIQHKPGKFEFANHGTMFLDEIGDMSFQLQAKLLQVLQDGEFSSSAARTTSTSTSASSPRPTRTSSRRSPTGSSARTSSSAQRRLDQHAAAARSAREKSRSSPTTS
jgi:hypothetical protein